MAITELPATTSAHLIAEPPEGSAGCDPYLGMFGRDRNRSRASQRYVTYPRGPLSTCRPHCGGIGRRVTSWIVSRSCWKGPAGNSVS